MALIDASNPKLQALLAVGSTASLVMLWYSKYYSKQV